MIPLQLTTFGQPDFELSSSAAKSVMDAETRAGMEQLAETWANGLFYGDTDAPATFSGLTSRGL